VCVYVYDVETSMYEGRLRIHVLFFLKLIFEQDSCTPGSPYSPWPSTTLKKGT
jgi:hypothetical protein